MSYNLKIDEAKNKAHDHAIATKILDLMNKLRFEKKEISPRRWIWELMQNAKDVAHDDIGVRIEINFEENDKQGFIEFKHNGIPFSIENLTFLIEQVSAKERDLKDNVKTTGKFGTGFLTTHLLSEIVEVEGIVKEPKEPYKNFKLLLDRSGRNIKDIIASVNRTLASLKDIDSHQALDHYSPSEISSIFRYKLNENGIEVAKKGLRDLSTSLFFTLVFLPEIKSVTIINDGIRYEYELSRIILKLGENIKIYTVTLDTLNGKSEIKIAVLSKNDTRIAAQIEDRNGQIYLKEFNPSIPRLFCDFPLVGTEDFSFPVIINSPLFNPNEPRNGVFLTDNDEKEIADNKKIMSDAIDLYLTLLEYASAHNWGNIYLLAKFPSVKEEEWLSKRWFEDSVIDPIQKKLLKTPLVDTESHGRISILDENDTPNIWFPSSPNESLRNKIWDLANLWIPEKLPRKADVNVWHSILWKGCRKLTLEVVTKSIQKKACLKKLREDLVKPTDPVKWLNEYYMLISLDEAFLDAITNDKYAVIPNQNGVFKKKSELTIDMDIEEELKNVLLILSIDVREYLLFQGIFTGKEIKYPLKEQSDVINEINKILRDNKNERLVEACYYLVSLFSADEDFPKEREEIFEFCQTMYPEAVNKKREIKKWSKDIWSEVDKKQLLWTTWLISETKNVEALTKKLKFRGTAETLSWLDRFISLLTQHEFDNFLNSKKMPILPNQNGNFRAKDDLFLDDGEIDETLKDISAKLGYDFRDELLDVNIYLELPQNRTKNQLHVAEEITRLIAPKFAEFPRSDETKQIFKRLYLWFNKNKEEAEKYFGELYKNKHRLYDDDEIAENIQKAEELSELMEDFDVSSVSDLRQMLQANRSQSLMEQRQQITQETLIGLGVTTIEQLEAVLKDKNIADKFIHESTPSAEMFRHAQGIINRAKDNIIAYLKTHPDYNCSDIEEIAPTVIGGIEKKGLSIQVVVRPSDNGKVIIYYSSEKDMLDYENAELWIDNGKDSPRHLTLGKILKNTGINRIPV